ncbi:MAG: Lrp/AsnC family transcriptional regulator [Sediminibacterium sp.]
MHELDTTDKLILKELQENNRVPAEELGIKLNLSTSAVQRRLKRLRTENIIEADIAVIAPEVVGQVLHFVVEVSLELGNAAVIEEFKQLMHDCEEVMQCYYVAGLFDFILLVNTKDMASYEAFSNMHLMKNKHVKQYYTHVVLNTVKKKYGVRLS